MRDLLRDSALGYLLRSLTGQRVLPYPESLPDFAVPKSFHDLEAMAGVDSEIATPASVLDKEGRDSQDGDPDALETLHRQSSIAN